MVNRYYSDFEEPTFEATGSMCFSIDMKIPQSKSPGNYFPDKRQSKLYAYCLPNFQNSLGEKRT